MAQKLTTEMFIVKARNTHGITYDYSQSTYVNTSTKVDIVCAIHGVFSQRPVDHIRGQKCPRCAKIQASHKITNNTATFIAAADKKHCGKYTYDNTVYINIHTPVIINCLTHGTFNCRPANHLQGIGCPKCKTQKLVDVNKSSASDFIEKSIKIHGDVYDYTNVIYTNNHTPVIIGCNKHGEFKQRPANHLNGNGCKKCSNERSRKNIGGYSHQLFNEKPELKNAPALLYLVELSTTSERLLKIGITTQPSVYDRFRSKRTFYGYNLRIVKVINTTLHTAFVIEQQIKHGFCSVQQYPSKKFDGCTECFGWSDNTQRAILSLMEPQQ